jgi:hypothetical protein
MKTMLSIWKALAVRGAVRSSPGCDARNTQAVKCPRYQQVDEVAWRFSTGLSTFSVDNLVPLTQVIGQARASDDAQAAAGPCRAIF